LYYHDAAFNGEAQKRGTAYLLAVIYCYLQTVRPRVKRDERQILDHWWLSAIELPYDIVTLAWSIGDG